MVSHDNLTYNAFIITKFLKLTEGKEVLVSYLPLSHVAAQVCQLIILMIIHY